MPTRRRSGRTTSPSRSTAPMWRAPAARTRRPRRTRPARTSWAGRRAGPCPGPRAPARWLGTIYTPSGPRAGSQRIYRGPFGASPFQSVYRRQSHVTDIANQLGVPTGVVLTMFAPLGVLSRVLAAPSAVGLALLAVL